MSRQLTLLGGLDALRSRIAELEADNAHLRGMLKISEQEASGTFTRLVSGATYAPREAVGGAQLSPLMRFATPGSTFLTLWRPPLARPQDGEDRHDENADLPHLVVLEHSQPTR